MNDQQKKSSKEDTYESEFPVKVSRDAYPRSDYRFPNAEIGYSYKTSKADFPRPTNAPDGAPNILLVLLDDVGYGWMNTFGGAIESPTLDKIAKDGIKYCQFHTTALCSPTRAALLTGRNHHTVSTGTIEEMGDGFPGYTGIIPQSCATIAELLSQNGYVTGWWGKNHNVPDNQTSQAGPFRRWPTQMGFDYFYGFISGETNQFYPSLYRGTTPVDPPYTPEQGYQLTRDLANDCIDWIRVQKSIAPDRPFFAYFAPGAAHAPHQPPLDWRGRHKGKFEMGWDEYRKITYDKQKKLGVIPEGTKLTPRPEEIPSWDSFNEKEKKLFSRFAENFADFLEHTDFEIGRVIEAIEQLGEYDNTLIIYIAGDNGSSAEGSLTGSHNEIMSLNGIQPSVEEIIDRIDDLGKPGTSCHYPVGWAWAGDTPFQWTKQIASHFGGTRNGLAVSWPKKIKDAGGMRMQFHHVIDIAPTILEVVGIKEPSMVNGSPQKPIEGVSMAYTFSKEKINEPSNHKVQYFEILGNRAMYKDGWIACCRHGRLPWEMGGSYDFDKDKWELYNIEEDYSESNDLSQKHPEKLKELQNLFLIEGSKYNVFPLDDRMAEKLDVSLRPSWFYNRFKVTFYPGMVRLPEGSAPKTNNISHTISIDVEIHEEGAEGVLVCLGGDTAGWSLYIHQNKLVYHYNWFDMERYEVVSDMEVPKGKVNLKVDFLNDTNKVGGSATVGLFINEKLSGKGKIAKQVPGRFGVESLDVGVDKLSPVNNMYRDKNGFPFTGKIYRVIFEFDGPGNELSEKEKLEMMIRMD